MAVSDAQFRLGVAAAGVVLIAGITVVRFCGSVSLPPKPASPPGPTGSQSQLLNKSAATPAIYLQYLQSDAELAGVPTPSIDDMSRTFTYRSEDARHVLEPGQPAIDLAGVKLSVERTQGTLVLAIANTTGSDLAYSIVTEPLPNTSACRSAPPLEHNVVVVGKGATQRRVECVWRDGMALAIKRVETLEVPPLSAWYVGLVPPSVLGIDPRVARGHAGTSAGEKCSTVVSQAVRSGREQGQIGWRDLVDFYARHRCPTYRFPAEYRAIKHDGSTAIPAVPAGM